MTCGGESVELRKLEKVIMWPVYFDSGKTRSQGRRAPKSLAILTPHTSEIVEAANRLGLEIELVVDAGYPREHSPKTGMVMVGKKEAKEKIIKQLAKQMLNLRNVAQKDQNR